MFASLGTAWHDFVYQPVYNLVVFAYNTTPGPNFGLAIISLAILIRFIFLPFTLRGLSYDKKLTDVKPLIEKIEHDETLSSREKLDRVHQITRPLGINPFIASLPLFAQVFFLGVLYQILQSGIYSQGSTNLYRFVNDPGVIDTHFFGFDLAKPDLVLSLAAAFLLLLERVWEYNQRKVVLKSFTQKWDPLIWPAFTFIILLVLPAAKAVFVATSLVYSFAIRAIVLKESSAQKKVI